MMAPEHERARVIGIAVDQANHYLRAPVDFIEIKGGRIIVGAGDRRIHGTYQYSNAYAPDGSSMPGSGHWTVIFEDGNTPTRAGWWARLLGR